MISIPFSGNKRYSYKTVKEIVKSGGYERVYEPFGGSCVLSVNLKKDNVIEEAVANDYDRFFDLYPEYLDVKDKVIEEGYKQGLRRTLHHGTKGDLQINPDGTRTSIKSRTLKGEKRKILQDIISEYAPEKYWRYFTYDSNFTHSSVSSHKTIKLNDFSKFDGYLKTDKQRKYLEFLDEIEVEHLDWKDFLNKHENAIRSEHSILILDPPYIGTSQEQYRGQFTEKETKELLDRVIELNCDFIFFNNDEELMKSWLEGVNYSIQFTGNSTSTCNKKRKDTMAYVRRDYD